MIQDLVPDGSWLLYTLHTDGDGVELFGVVRRRDIEGDVAKWKRDAHNSVDAEDSGVKAKTPAYSQMEGRPIVFNAL